MSEVVQRDPEQYAHRDLPKLAGADPQDILDQVADGALLRDIAASLGVGQPAISNYMARHVSKNVWNEVREQSMEARLEKAEQMLTDERSDAVMLARAREAARLWMWRAEREFPHRWGARPTTAVQVNAGESGVQLVVYGQGPQGEPQSK